MARPKTYDERRVATAVRLPQSVHQRLHEAASERHVSANLLVTQAVTDLLDRLPTVDSLLGSDSSTTDSHRLSGPLS